MHSPVSWGSKSGNVVLETQLCPWRPMLWLLSTVLDVLSWNAPGMSPWKVKLLQRHLRNLQLHPILSDSIRLHQQISRIRAMAIDIHVVLPSGRSYCATGVSCDATVSVLKTLAQRGRLVAACGELMVQCHVWLCKLYESVCCDCICLSFVGLPVSFCFCPCLCVCCHWSSSESLAAHIPAAVRGLNLELYGLVTLKAPRFSLSLSWVRLGFVE